MTLSNSQTRGLIGWFATNPVAANLLMFVIVFAGIVVSQSIRKQTTPEFELNVITVSVAYPGAAPQEVEQGILTRIEEALSNVAGIEEISSTASEG
ncbi:MAG: efflux RND transporter permease subunit, partial [Pseudomonadota bacterium]